MLAADSVSATQSAALPVKVKVEPRLQSIGIPGNANEQQRKQYNSERKQNTKEQLKLTRCFIEQDISDEVRAIFIAASSRH
jgi:hypothetical protein